MDANTKLVRALLLVFGCVPMCVLYAVLSLAVFIFALPATLLGGNLGNVVFVIWWLFGTYGLVALVYSCANYRRESARLKRWQQAGLIAGVFLAVPLVALGFTHGLGVLAAVLGAAAASVVLVTDRGRVNSQSEVEH